MEGIIKFSKVTINCPACNKKVEAVAHDGVVAGYCAVARKNIKLVVSNENQMPVVVVQDS